MSRVWDLGFRGSGFGLQGFRGLVFGVQGFKAWGLRAA